jgi:hypothetical protein
MTFNPFGYTDPGQQVQQQGAYLQGAPGGPLVGLDGSIQQVMSGAQPQGPRRHSVAENMAIGAAVGFGSWLVWQRMKSRHQRTGTYVHPVFWFLAIWWAFMIAGFALSMEWVAETGYILGTAFVLGTVLSFAYAVYRFTGHGRYNTRRRARS